MLASRTPVPVEVVAPEERFAPEAEAAAYYVIAETLTNVAKYAQATSARVEVAQSNGSLQVLVSDDGVGGADPAEDPGSADWPTASPSSTGRSRSSARSAEARRSARRSR